MPRPTMTGTTGTTYKVVRVTERGAIGFRPIYSGYRVRVVPSSTEDVESIGAVLTRAAYWKQPEGDPGEAKFRFSTVVEDSAELKAALNLGLKALGEDGPKQRRSVRDVLRRFMRQLAPA